MIVRKKPLYFQRLALVIGCTAIPTLSYAAALDKVEPNDEIANAQVIDASFDTSASPDIKHATFIPHVSISATGNDTYDFYQFTVVTAGSYGIFDTDYGTHDIGGSFDTYIRLYDSTGTLVKSDDDSSFSDGANGSTSGLDSYFTHTFTEAGIYTLKVSRYSDSVIPASGDYVLQISLTDADLATDTDGDGMPDSFETHFSLDPSINDSLADADGDLLTNFAEYQYGSDPSVADTDLDGLSNATDTDDDNDGLTDAEEAELGTNPLLTDSDSDGMPDGWEAQYGLNPLLDDASSDSDSDTVTNIDEFTRGSDPSSTDTDNDGLENAVDEDDDNDGLTDVEEAELGTNPLSTDSDSDGMLDNWEVQYGLNPTLDDASDDLDSDGLTNLREREQGSNPTLVDTDEDGLNDGDEVSIHNTTPTRADSDYDGLSDGDEINIHNTLPRDSDTDNDGLNDGSEVNTHNTDPLIADSDEDGLNDGAEINTHNTDPALADSDSDGMSDGWEVEFALDPLLNDAAGDVDTDTLSNLREFELGTNPTLIDSDADGLSDADEINIYSTNPTNNDSDNDGMPDGWEINYALDPLVGDDRLDSDGDGFTNYQEFNEESDPSDALSIPIARVGTGLIGHFEMSSGQGTTEYGAIIEAAGYQAESVTDLSTANLSLYDMLFVFNSNNSGYSSIYVQNKDRIFDFINQGGIVILHDRHVTNAATILPGSPGNFVRGTFRDLSIGDAGLSSFYNGPAGTIDDDSMDHGSSSSHGYVELDSIPANSNIFMTQPATGNPVTYSYPYGSGHIIYSSIPLDCFVTTSCGLKDVFKDTYPINLINFAGQELQSFTDTDSDGMSDTFETQYGFDINDPADALLDLDGDGLINLQEAINRTDPSISDTDGDGLTDADEFFIHRTNPALADTDRDGLNDYDELNTHNTDPFIADSDEDGMTDGWEVQYGLNPLLDDASLDSDSDSITNIDEFTRGSDPTSTDTDNDGLENAVDEDDDNDGLTDIEEAEHGTNPLLADTDSDGMLDNWEVQYGLNPLVDDANDDFDSDGLTNIRERHYNTDPSITDTDGDGLSDGDEVNIHNTYPYRADSDYDGLSDGDEVNIHQTLPRDSDTDNDGINDGADVYPLIPLNGLTDTDNDGAPNECDADCVALGMSADLDDDNDGVADLDDTFPLISLNGRTDTDGDGIPNECNSACEALGMTEDLDDDNDGTPDEFDAFPFDSAEQSDTDGDGIGDVADTDDDNDGVDDNVDPNIGDDNGAPTLIAIAADASTSVTTDNGYNALVTLDNAFFTQFIATDAVDDNLYFEASLNGQLLTLDENNQLLLPAGDLNIVWTAIDDAGNRSNSMIQNVKVYPRVRFVEDTSIIGESSNALIQVELTGTSPDYPVVIELSFDELSDINQDDLSPEFDISRIHQITIEQGDAENPNTAAQLSVPVINDGQAENNERLLVNLEGVVIDEIEEENFYVIDENHSQHTLTVTYENLAPTLQIKMEQGGKEVANITQDAGDVTITAIVTDGNGDDVHTFRWDLNSLGLNAPIGHVLSFNPANIPEGTHSLTITVTDNGINSLAARANLEFDIIAPIESSDGRSNEDDSASDNSSSGGGALQLWLLLLLATGLLGRKKQHTSK